MRAVAAAPHRPRATAKQLQQLGLTEDDYEDDDAIEVWPANVQAVRLWERVGRQWRMGFAGPVALDLMPVLHELDRMVLSTTEYDELLDDIQDMASAALLQMHCSGTSVD